MGGELCPDTYTAARWKSFEASYIGCELQEPWSGHIKNFSKIQASINQRKGNKPV
jgi:hypothetical protein